MNAYDFDGTIYDGDSSIDFYLFCLKKNKKVLLSFPRLTIGVILYILTIINKTKMKERIFSFLKHLKDTDLYVEEFWKDHKKKIKPWYLKQKQKSDIIISASPEFLLKPLEEELKVSVIASKVDKTTGKFDGKNCHDYEKIKRFEELYPEKKIKAFYTDSIKADYAMLEYAKEAYLVKKERIIPLKKDKNNQFVEK